MVDQHFVGGLSHWKRLRASIVDDPWGPVARRRVEETIALDPPYGTGTLFADVIIDVRARAEANERDAVAAEIQDLLARSGLTRTEFASRIGTSASRLSTYLTGRVTPSAALLIRMRRMLRNQD